MTEENKTDEVKEITPDFQDPDFLDFFRKQCEGSKIGSTERMIHLFGCAVLERLDALVHISMEYNEMDLEELALLEVNPGEDDEVNTD